MSFRVTSSMAYHRLMANIRQCTATLSDLQEQMVTLRRINRPSDDPLGAGQVQSLRSSENDYQLYMDNIDHARGVLDFTAGVLQNVSSEIVTVRSKLMEAINPVTDATSRAVIATEVNDILKSIVAEANSAYAGMAVFGGTQTAGTPFQIDAESGRGVEAVSFHGNSSRIAYTVGPDSTVEINEDPVEVFMPRGAASGLFETL